MEVHGNAVELKAPSSTVVIYGFTPELTATELVSQEEFEETQVHHIYLQPGIEAQYEPDRWPPRRVKITIEVFDPVVEEPVV